MNTKIVKNLQNDQTELEKESVKNDETKFTKGTQIELCCAFYEKCALPKNESLCNHFPDFMICTDYLTKRNKILNEN